MGNSQNTQYELSDEKMYEAEQGILENSGIPLSEIKRENIMIDDTNHIRTISVGDASKQTLVIVHGYGGAGVLFYKMLKPLTEHYYVILIDQLGMGASSRPDKNILEMTLEETDDYLVDWMERWRKAMGDLKDFILAGHSFGGYVCGHYALKYHKYIRKLLMLSPFGVSSKPEDWELELELQCLPKRPPGFAISLAQSGFYRQISPFGILRTTGCYISSKFLQQFSKIRLSGLTEDEQKFFETYLYQVLLRPGSTEYCVFNCFTIELFAKNPLDAEDKLCQLPIPVSFYYGQKDWMRRYGVRRILQKNPYKDKQSRFIEVPNSDHHMYFDNPEAFAKLMIKDLSTLPEMVELPPQQIRAGKFLEESYSIKKGITQRTWDYL